MMQHCTLRPWISTCVRPRVANERSVVVRGGTAHELPVKGRLSIHADSSIPQRAGWRPGVYLAGKFEDLRTATRNELLFCSRTVRRNTTSFHPVLEHGRRGPQ